MRTFVVIGLILVSHFAMDARADDLVAFRVSTAQWSGSHTQPGPVYLNGLTTTTLGWGASNVGEPSQIALVGDVNGDGIDDTVFVQAGGGGVYNWLAIHSTSTAGVGSFGPPHPTPPYSDSSISGFGLVSNNLGCFLADVNGDGYEDAVTINGGFYWNVYYSSASGLGGGGAGNQVQFGGTGDIPLVGDLNGDGLADIVVFRSYVGGGYWYVSKSGVGGLGAGGSVSGQFGDSVAGTIPLVGDINGDGRADAILVRDVGGNGTLEWLACYADSAGLIAFTGGGGVSSQISFGRVGDTPYLADINGDGRMDAGLARDSNINGAKYYYSKFTGSDGNFVTNAVIDDVQAFGVVGDKVLIAKLGMAPAVSDENCIYTLFGDYNTDCTVDLEDFVVLASRWMIDCIATPSDPECIVPNY